MNEISTKYKATEKLSSWIRRQLQSAAQYVPRKGGICRLCGRFCRTNRTDPETGIRFHRCEKCGVNFKSVGQSPTKDDSEPAEQLDIDNKTEKPAQATVKTKPKRKR